MKKIDVRVGGLAQCWIDDAEVSYVGKEGEPEERDDVVARDRVGGLDFLQGWRVEESEPNNELLYVDLQSGRCEALKQALGLRARLDDEVLEHPALGRSSPHAGGEGECFECPVSRRLCIVTR